MSRNRLQGPRLDPHPPRGGGERADASADVPEAEAARPDLPVRGSHQPRGDVQRFLFGVHHQPEDLPPVRGLHRGGGGAHLYCGECFG